MAKRTLAEVAEKMRDIDFCMLSTRPKRARSLRGR